MELSKNAKLMVSYLFDRINSLDVDTVEISFKEVEDINRPVKMNEALVFKKKDYNIEEIILNPDLVVEIHPHFIDHINVFVDKEKHSFLQLTGIIDSNNDYIITLGLLSSKGKILCPQIEVDKKGTPQIIPVDFDLMEK